MTSARAYARLEAEAWLPGTSWQPLRDAIDVWRIDWAIREPIARVTGSPETIDAWAEQLLSPRERDRAQRLVVPAKRRQFMRSRAALRSILARAAGVEPASLRFSSGPHGRPEIDGLLFNLSHSGTVAVVAVGPVGASPMTQLGVDVERLEAERPVTRLVERFFAPGEAEAFARVPEAERAADFARRWALKEAYVKALSTGLTYSSQQFVLRDDPVSWNPRPLVTSCARYGDAHLDWTFRNSWVDVGSERFAVAVCSDQPMKARRFRFDFPGDRE